MSGGATDYAHLLRDNYETPLYTPQLAGGEFELQQLEMILRLSVDDFKAHALTLSSPDELSMYIARRLMQQEAPSLLWITMHDIDIAHAGAYSLYIDGIRRTDRLCAELWKAAQSEPEYAGNTTLFILPDFGRDADEDSGGNGFQHHRTGDAASRTTWMMALGAGVRQGVVYDQPMQSIDLVPTLGAMMGFSPSLSPGQADQRVDLGNWCSVMLPRDLKAEQFASYPPQARALVVAHLDALRQLPLSFLPSLLREVIDYDYKFPAERAAIDRELANLSSLSPAQMTDWFHGFAQFSLSPKLGKLRLDQSAGPVCRAAIGLLVDDSPVGWLSPGGDRLRRSFAGRQTTRADSCAQARHCGHRSGCHRLRCAALSQPAPARRLFCARQAR